MPHSPISAPLAALRESLDLLALEITLRDLWAPEQIRPFASKIAQQAEAAGVPAVARIAVELAHSASAQALRDLLSRMQQLLAPPLLPALNQDLELVADFILESREHLSAIESQLLALEQDP